MARIAIIGAGLSGLVLADRLGEGADIEIFEKSRGAGGRMATRYADPFQFDHGAQYFTARRPAFTDFLKRFIETGVVAEWQPDFVTLEEGKAPAPYTPDHPRYVAVPKMNALCKALAEPREIKLQTRIVSLTPSGQRWMLEDESGVTHGPYDWVVSSVPAPQARELLPDDFTGQPWIAKAKMTGNFTLMLGYEQPLDLSWQGAATRYSPIGWIAVNNNKPGRETGWSMVVQSTDDWAESHLEDDKQEVQNMMMEELSALLGHPVPQPDHLALHRWRYAATPEAMGEPFIADEKQRLAACGDWCLEGKIEGAFESGNALADYLQERID